MDYQSQTRTVLNHLKGGNVISSIAAFKRYGITRLSRVIHDLREQGYRDNIITELVNRVDTDRMGRKVSKQWAVYKWVDNES
jgi:hypothetical protein